MAKETIRDLRRRIRSLQVQHAAAKHQGQERKAELVAGALQVDEAKLAMLLARSVKRNRRRRDDGQLSAGVAGNRWALPGDAGAASCGRSLSEGTAGDIAVG